MSRKIVIPLLWCLLSAPLLLAQGLETAASPDDWEEINFEFDSSVLTDGYPSLLRLAELLNQNSGYRVELIGHTDFRGADQYNVALGRRRAEMIRDFLLKYGASDAQISIATRGEEVPKVPNETDEGRWMNRRVTMEVRDAEGAVVGAGGVGEAINGIEQTAQMAEECCNEILSRLEKLDEILDLLQNLQDENDRLTADVAELKARETPEPPPVPTATEVAAAVEERIDQRPTNKYATFNINAGPSSNGGNLSVTGQGRAFVPFARRHAVQAQGEYLHYLGRDEGQFDLGLVSRWGRVQAGGFSSFKYVKFSEWDKVGGLGQASLTLDYVFDRGRVGFFGTKGFMDGAVVNSRLLRPNAFEETYLAVVDQAGVSTAVGAWGDAWFEGNFGALFRRGGSNKPGGTIRYIHPLNEGIALTLEGGLNETFVNNDNSGRFVVGLQFGNWLSPKQYGDVEDRPVPVDVPRVRYEVLTRTVRTGNDSPVADAGPDRIGIDPGPIVLDGSGSHDPDGDPITYEWAQISGDSVELSGANTAQASFTVQEAQDYQFRLTVRDDRGGVGIDRVTVSSSGRELSIRRFTVSPTTVAGGEQVTLAWDVAGATEVEIAPSLGMVDNVGSSTVPVNETTTFTLTARNNLREISETVTVTVDADAPRILSFNATPQMIVRGDAAVLAWETENADNVTIDGIGSVGTSGTATVSPAETTTYRLTASNAAGEISRTVTVTVDANAPRILSFIATPQQILPGETSTLVWEVENADEVMISQVGQVDLGGTTDVSPEETTEYTITARNETGEVSATAIVTVGLAVRIIEFSADKTTVQDPGDPAQLTWLTENAVRVELVNVGEVEPEGSTTVNPVGPTIYTLIAYGRGGASVSATVKLNVENANRSPNAVAVAPRVILVPSGTEFGRATLDGSRSSDPDGDPITFEWRSLGPLEAVISNPNAMNPTVQFRGGYGEYNFELMVTDDKGAMGFDQEQVFWVDP